MYHLRKCFGNVSGFGKKKRLIRRLSKKNRQRLLKKPQKPHIMAKKNSETPTIQKPVAEPQPVAASSYEDKSAFANGLPAWTLEPPQVLVKRRSLK